jgi:hypothetical protein
MAKLHYLVILEGRIVLNMEDICVTADKLVKCFGSAAAGEAFCELSDEVLPLTERVSIVGSA